MQQQLPPPPARSWYICPLQAIAEGNRDSLGGKVGRCFVGVSGDDKTHGSRGVSACVVLPCGPDSRTRCNHGGSVGRGLGDTPNCLERDGGLSSARRVHMSVHGPTGGCAATSRPPDICVRRAGARAVPPQVQARGPSPAPGGVLRPAGSASCSAPGRLPLGKPSSGLALPSSAGGHGALVTRNTCNHVFSAAKQGPVDSSVC